MITILILIMVAYFPSPKKLKFDHIKICIIRLNIEYRAINSTCQSFHWPTFL